MLNAFPAEPPTFPGRPHWEALGEDTRGLLGYPGCCRLKTEPPHTQNSGTRLTVWGIFGATLHKAAWFHRCSLAGGSPLITSLVQGEAVDAKCISSPTPDFSRQPALGGKQGRHAKGS